ncbi:MAG: hypothetical protein Q9181_001813 [Wetmoreana brouardii]
MRAVALGLRTLPLQRDATSARQSLVGVSNTLQVARLPRRLAADSEQLLFALDCRELQINHYLFTELRWGTADPLSVVASIITLLDSATRVSKYLRAVKDGPQERNVIQSELSNAIGVLYSLKDHVENEEREGALFSTVKALKLEQKLSPAKGIKRVTTPIVWPFRKEDVRDALSRLHRLQDIFNFALHNDHIRIASATHATISELKEEVGEVNKKITQMSISKTTRLCDEWALLKRSRPRNPTENTS